MQHGVPSNGEVISDPLKLYLYEVYNPVSTCGIVQIVVFGLKRSGFMEVSDHTAAIRLLKHNYLTLKLLRREYVSFLQDALK